MARRFQTVGRDIPEPESAAMVSRIVRRFEKATNRLQDVGRPQAESRMRVIQCVYHLAVCRHLEVADVEGLEGYIGRGVNAAVAYFSGDWWQAHESDAPFLDRNHEFAPQGWHWPLRFGLSLCDWSNRWRDAEVMLDWVDDSVARGFTKKQDGDLDLPFYLAIASTLRSEKLACDDELMAAGADSDTAFRRARFALLSVIRGGDSDDVQSVFDEAVKQFAKTGDGGISAVTEGVSVDLGLLYLVARRLGVPVPTLSPMADAIVPRRETVGGGSPAPTVGDQSQLTQQELNEGLLQSVIELESNVARRLLGRGADCKTVVDHTFAGRVIRVSPHGALVAIRNRFWGIEIVDRRLSEITDVWLRDALQVVTADEVEDALAGLCDLFEVARHPGEE